MRLGFKTLLGFGLVLGYALMVTAADPPSSALATVKAHGKLVMLCFPHQDNPFIQVNLDTGPMHKVGTVENFKGIDVELMAAFAKRVGVALEMRPISQPSYGELIPALLRGEGDVIASSFSATADRRQQVDFSIPYFVNLKSVVVRKGHRDIKGQDDLKKYRGAVVPGSSQEEILRKLGVPKELMYSIGFPRDGYLAVRDGAADYTVVDSTIVNLMIAEMPQLVIAFKWSEGDDYCVAAPKGSDLLPVLNRFIEQLRASGELDRMINSHIPSLPKLEK